MRLIAGWQVLGDVWWLFFSSKSGISVVVINFDLCLEVLSLWWIRVMKLLWCWQSLWRFWLGCDVRGVQVGIIDVMFDLLAVVFKRAFAISIFWIACANVLVYHMCFMLVQILLDSIANPLKGLLERIFEPLSSRCKYRLRGRERRRTFNSFPVSERKESQSLLRSMGSSSSSSSGSAACRCIGGW